jgi:hypothetical protein
MRGGPWTFVAGCIYEPPLGEAARGDFFVDVFSPDAARKVVAKLNELQAQVPRRLERSAPPRQVRAKPRREGRRHDRPYMLRVKELPCVVASWTNAGTCTPGGCDANHVGDRGLSQKSHDDETVPMCRGHHREWTDHAGVFREMPKGERREWAKAWVSTTRAELGWTEPKEMAA